MNVLISDRQKDLPIKHERQKLQIIAMLILDAEKQKCDEIALHFVTSLVICKLHKKFFDDASITDCITFPMDKDPQAGFCYLGDIFICPKQALIYASENEQDPYREITLYVVHGLLHLLGYDDITPEDRKVMRAKEKKYMKLLEKTGNILCPN